MTVVAVVQARMSSRRFPGKMLAEIGGRPMAVQVCRRAAAARKVERVVLATSDQPEDDPLASAVEAAAIAVHRGSLDDVLTRFAGAARAHGATTVLRITGDCPLVDPDVIDAMLERFAAGGYDYFNNVTPRTFPDGLDVEIMNATALERAVTEASPGHEREHVTPFLRSHPERFRHGSYARTGPSLAGLHWSVDHPSDLEIVRELLGEAGGPDARLPALLDAITRRPDLEARSRAKVRNDGPVAGYLAHLDRLRPRAAVANDKRVRTGTPVGALLEDVRAAVAQFALGEVLLLGDRTTFAGHQRATASQIERLFRLEMLRFGVLFDETLRTVPAHGDADVATILTAYRHALGVLRFALDQDIVDALVADVPGAD